jgi:hypothetical protein
MEYSAAQTVINMNRYNYKDSCECKEQINVQSQLIDSLRTRIEELETDFNNKDQDIKKLQQDFQSIRNNSNKPSESYSFDEQLHNNSPNQSRFHSKEKQYENEGNGRGSRIPLRVRKIDNLNSVKYPPHIKPPNPALNYNTKMGKFRYDLGFLMQFKEICKEKPKNLLVPEVPEGKFHNERKERRRRKKECDIIDLPALDMKVPKDDKENLSQSQIEEFKFPMTSEERFTLLTNEKSGVGNFVENFIPKVKALLNKLTWRRFDSILDQIIEYANRSRNEKDGSTLKGVIRLIVEESSSQKFSAIYAQLCCKMMERIDPEIVDENVKNTEGKFFRGSTLFRKYLLNYCQEGFEKTWKDNIPVPSNDEELLLMSYAVAKAKNQRLGLMRFIGEIFKLNMLTERIMHECIKKLLFQDPPEQEEMESLCELMNIVGEQLDHVKTNKHDHIKANQVDHAKLMESYFARMKKITKLPNLPNRIKFMIMVNIL